VLVGDYPEQVRLRSGVTVRSHVPREAVLRGIPSSTGPAVLAEGIHGARLSGFQILGDPHTPLSPAVLLENASVEIDDVDISGAGVGIQIQGGAPRVVGNSVHDCAAEGILISGDATPWISHNSLQHNKGAGLAARTGSKPSLVNNVFEKNTVDLPLDVSNKRDFLIDIPKARPAAVPNARPREEIPQVKKK
jgi:hypothetical protein